MAVQLKPCEQPDGHFCLCFIPISGSCTGLENTHFENGCPFFKDVRTISREEIICYRTGAYRRRDGRAKKH